MSLRDEALHLGLISVQYVRVYFSKANQETPVKHDLAGEVLGAAVVKKDQTCDIWSGQMPSAPNVLYAVCDTDGVTATFRVEAVNVSER